MQDYKNIIYKTLSKLGCKQLYDKIELKIINVKSFAGDAIYENNKGLIRLSKRYISNSNPQYVNELIVHETCHIVNMYFREMSLHWRNFDFDDEMTKGHGEGWKFLMDFCGYKGCIRTQNYAGKEIYSHKCGKCKNIDLVSKYLHTKINKGTTKKYCSKCGEKVCSNNLKLHILAD